MLNTTSGLSEVDRDTLVEVATTAIRAVLEDGRSPVPIPQDHTPPLREHAATFVTLERGDSLLGCIGGLEPRRPLVVDVAANAVAAAFADPRLPPLTRRDYAVMAVKVSVLGPTASLRVASLPDLIATLRPGSDGVVLRSGARRATLLPSVWPKVGSAEEFVEVLWSKAGLPPGHWGPDVELSRYETVEFGDPGPRAPLR